MIYLNDHLQDLELADALTRLSEQRREQALRYRHDFGQRACAAAYLLLCEGLRKEYGISELPLFAYGNHGKPSIIGHEEIHFNLSHCREGAVCAISDHPVGIDIESVRSYNPSLAQYTMNDSELQQIQQATDPALAFTRFWTMKEALLKLTGEGITNHLKGVLLHATAHFETVVAPDHSYVYTVCQE